MIYSSVYFKEKPSIFFLQFFIGRYWRFIDDKIIKTLEVQQEIKYIKIGVHPLLISTMKLIVFPCTFALTCYSFREVDAIGMNCIYQQISNEIYWSGGIIFVSNMLNYKRISHHHIVYLIYRSLRVRDIVISQCGRYRDVPYTSKGGGEWCAPSWLLNGREVVAIPSTRYLLVQSRDSKKI